MTRIEWSSIRARISQAMLVDQFRLRRRLRGLQEDAGRGQDVAAALIEFEDRLRQSCDRRQRRAEAVPDLRFADELPIAQKRGEIAELIQAHQVVVVCGETGSGKSTQLPKICLSIGRGIQGLIGHTQPRRIAARTIAARLADELDTQVGAAVGFKIRFTDRVDPTTTYIKLMTDGIMLAETQNDRFLEQYDTIILDEAHERSLNIDFLLGYIQRILPKRPDLRLIITSATIDAERFAEHFSREGHPVPVIEVSGRTFPVDVEYRPLDEASEEEQDAGDAVVAAVGEISTLAGGDILVFFPTERDIRDAAKKLRGAQKLGQFRRSYEILPLYARLSNAEQNKVFKPQGKPRIVLATNVAESSLTVPGIRYVVDSGTARISRYAPRSKVQRLPIEAVSRASADQRKGRCGRIGPGVCFRLYSEEDYLSRDRYTTPEIRRTNLASVILQTKALKLGPIEEFPFLDPPRAEAIRDGYKTLIEIGALDRRQQLTKIGRRLSQLPVDPRIARMILAGDDEGCLSEMLIITAALEIQDPRERPADKQQAADEAHAQFANEHSDFLAYLNIWDMFHHWKDDLSRSRLQKACRQNFLSYVRMREWMDVHRQLKQLVAAQGLKPQPRRDESDAIHRALLTGLLSNVAYRAEPYEYTGAGGNKFVLWPGSGVFSSKPKWVIAAELVETTRRFIRNVARINPDWIEPLAGHLVKRSYNDPFWSSKQGCAMTYEQVTLFGLMIVARRRVPLARQDSETARRLLIEHGLVEGEMAAPGKFFHRNAEVVEKIRQLGAKMRQPGFVVDDYRKFQFYDRRLPPEVFDRVSLQQWLKRDAQRQEQLCWTQEDLLENEDEAVSENAFPDALETDELQLPLTYRFEPGGLQDGITVTVPVEGLGQLSSERLGWIVPGLIEEKIIALIRSLPKPIRRNLVPAPDTARLVSRRLEHGNGSFLQAVAAQLSNVAEQPIPLDAFRLEKIPAHLQLNVCAVDQQGEVVAQSRNLTDIRQQLGAEPAGPVAEISSEQWTRDGLTDWDFDELPKQIQITRGRTTVTAYPSLLDRGQTVSLRLLDSRPLAKLQTGYGVRRLFTIRRQRSLREQVAWLPELETFKLMAHGLVEGGELEDQLGVLIADRCLLTERPMPRTRDEFAERMTQAADRLPLAVRDVAKTIPPLFECYHRVRLALDDVAAERWAYAREDMQDQLREMLPADFLVRTPWLWLQHLPRYLKGIELRIEKLGAGGGQRDRESHEVIQDCRRIYEAGRQRHVEQAVSYDDELVTYRWMMEELRISLFAQSLGTAFSISPQRMRKQWAKVRGVSG